MTNAYDRACHFLPDEVRESAAARRKLALHILHRVELGELDAMSLAASAVLSVRSWSG